jgi:hypothetical protein
VIQYPDLPEAVRPMSRITVYPAPGEGADGLGTAVTAPVPEPWQDVHADW